MSNVTPHWLHRTRTLSLLSSTHCLPHMSYVQLSASMNPAEIYGHKLSGALAEPRPFTWYEPRQLAENQDHMHFTEDKQFAEHEDLRVKPLYFHQPSIASTCDSAENIVTPLQTRTWTMSNFLLCWIHHCTCRSEKQMQNDRKFITLN